MPTIRSALRACALVTLLLAHREAAAQFNQCYFYFFRDSLTDAASFKPLLPPGIGLFATKPGRIWAQIIAQRLGSTARPRIRQQRLRGSGPRQSASWPSELS